MDIGVWDDIREKVGMASAKPPAIYGVVAVLALVIGIIGFALSNVATAHDFEVETDEASALPADSPEIAASLYVHVSGAVAKPGLYGLAEGSRVADAVQAAGGFADDAAQDSCNLARKVEDGEHVIVMSTQQVADGAEIMPTQQETPTAAGLVNINTASAEQLESLPGIGAATAQKIVADRTANGPFKATDDLTRVSGIGAKKLSALEGLICV